MDVDDQADENFKKTVDTMAQSLPQEPLLGSITTNAFDKDEKGMLIRSSARVFKKMKLEQELDKKHDESHTELAGSMSSPSTENILVGVGSIEKPLENENKGQPVRASTRVVKKAKHDTANPNVQETKTKKDDSKSDNIKKVVRTWSYEDKMMFFEAVNEFGKDFENIQQHINSKLKKRGASEDHLKAKEHVRQFYNRTFHEVSKHVKFSDSVKKVVQELYGIINYGELHKKLGVITEKACMKLNELIYRGATCIRIKGKTIRIKTPMCRALIKLNQLDEKYEDVKLPNRVTVELRPKDMESYLHVQCLAQNPRVKTTLPIQKRLIALIQCLNKRWKTVDAANYEKSISSTNAVTNDCVPSKQESAQKFDILCSLLRLSPPQEAKIELPSINISEYFTRQTICLTAYEGRLGLDTFSDIKMMSKKKKQKLDIEHKADTVCDSVKVENVKVEECESTSCNEAEPDTLLADAVHDAVNTILSLQTCDRQHSETSETDDTESKNETIHKEQFEQPKLPEINKEALEQIERIRKGWTERTSECLTIGEIYLMYGCDSKLILEYSWEEKIKEDLEKPKAAATNFLERWNEQCEEMWERKQHSLTTSLAKLLSLAKLHYRKNAIQCPCGHICNSKTMKSPPNIINPRMRRSTVSDNNISLNNIKQEAYGSITVLSNVPNGQSQITSSVARTPVHIVPKGPAIHSPTMQQQLNSIQRLKPKFCNRKGRRPRSKPIVVARKLPLLPNNLSGHQIVRMSIISQEPQMIPPEPQPPIIINQPIPEEDLPKVFADPEEENSVISTVPSSPSRILKEGDSEWINSEVADYSLSSLLGHLESPVKHPVGASIGTLNSNMAADLSNEVDAQLQSLLTESSMDFAANFADLAASVASDKKF